MESKPKLLVTGVNGNLGSWICKYALESGEYKVYGTVRDSTSEKTQKQLKDAFGDHYDELTLVSLDLLDNDSIKKAVEGMDYVMSQASPLFPKDAKTEDDYIRPAVDGFLAIMEASRDNGVKRIVFTGSIGCILDYTKKGEYTADETQFAPSDGVVYSYTKSKILQEQEVWKSYEAMKDDPKRPEVLFLLPGVLFGPVLLKECHSAAMQVNLLTSNLSSRVPPFYSGLMDITEAARVHMVALKQGRSGERYIICGEETCKFSEYASHLGKYKKMGYKIADKDAGCFLLWIGSLFDEFTKFMYRVRNRKINLKNGKAVKELGLKIPPYKETMEGMAESLIENGYVKDLRNN